MKRIIILCIVFLLSVSLAHAGTFEFRGSTDKVSINEEMGDVVSAVSGEQLSDLKGGSVTTKEGSTSYAQFIRFKDTATALNTSAVRFAKNDNGESSDFLVFNRGSTITDAFFEWHMNFPEGLKSKITNKLLDGLNDVKVKIFSEEYTIIDSLLDGKNIKLTFAKGAINDILREGEKKIYTIGEKTYEITVVNIETGTKQAKFKVNAKETKQLQKSEIEEVDTGVFIGINDIIPNTNDPTGSVVKFFIGANVLEMKDENYEDNTFSREVYLNKEKLEFGFAKISAALVNDVLKITDIKYRLINNEAVYVRTGESLRSKIDKPQSLLGDWDIRFASLESTAISRIKLIPSPDNEEYRLEFVSSTTKTLNIPFLSNKASFKFGDSTKDFIFVEGASSTDYNIDKNDYFAMTSANTKNGKTYVLTYDSINIQTNTVFFTEVGGNQISVTYANSSAGGALGEGTLSIGSMQAKVFIEDSAANRLAIDLDGDGTVQGSDALDLIVQGGGIIDLPSSNTISGSSVSLGITTDGSQFEESTSSESITFSVESASAAPKIGISESLTGITTVRSSSNHIQGLSDYGVRVDLVSSTDRSDTLTIEYPQSQLFAKLVIDVNVGSKITTKVEESKETQCSNQKQDGDETGIDCGGSCGACPTCDDNVQNQGEGGVDCGGPCPKICAPQEKQSETCNGCWQILEKGKKNCLPLGTKLGALYCDKSGLLVPLKKNGEACTEAYECSKGRCEEGKCGRNMTFGLLIMNIGIIVLILSILYYVFTLLK